MLYVGFVHRLILNQPDGKMVEMPDLQSLQQRGSNAPVTRKDTFETEEERDAFYMASMDSKLVSMTREYEILLTHQLEELRRSRSISLSHLHAY